MFDIDCTHSFIAPRIVKKLSLKTSTLSYPLRITAARGEPEFTTLRVQTLEFDIQGEIYVWDFVVFELREFNVILGMDWLGKNQTFLDYEKKGC